ncbi:MAG: pyrroline-5-carboxylate reductase [Christensenellaceae bacterium]
MNTFKTGFIGCGNMASSIINGMQRLQNRGEIFAYDKDSKKCRNILGITVCKNINELVEKSQIIFLCVKPNVIPEVLSQITDENKAFISIAAGVTVEKIRSYLKPKSRILRIMPNTPLMVAKGAICMQYPNDLRPDESDYITELFSSLGIIEQVSGELMDSVTGVSGSGPAYVYLFIDALAKAGEANGLSKDTAQNLAIQTFEGACAMLKQTKEMPETLIRNVCSPGGTTIEAMSVFNKRHTYEIIKEAVDACVEKSKELSK